MNEISNGVIGGDLAAENQGDSKVAGSADRGT